MVYQVVNAVVINLFAPWIFIICEISYSCTCCHFRNMGYSIP